MRSIEYLEGGDSVHKANTEVEMAKVDDAAAEVPKHRVELPILEIDELDI